MDIFVKLPIFTMVRAPPTGSRLIPTQKYFFMLMRLNSQAVPGGLGRTGGLTSSFRNRKALKTICFG